MSAKKRPRLPNPTELLALRDASKSCAKALNDAGALEPPATASPVQLLSWAILRCGKISLISDIVQVLHDCGHLGQNFVLDALRAIELEIESLTLESIVKLLLPIREELESIGSGEPLILVTPHSICPCGTKIGDSSSINYSKGVLHDSKPSSRRVTVARIYCQTKECKRSHGPWCIKRNWRTTETGTREVSEIDNMAAQHTYYELGATDYIEATEKQFLRSSLCELYANMLLHGWTSYEAFAEAFCETIENTTDNLQLNDDDEDEPTMLSRRVLSKAFIEYEIWQDQGQTNNTVSRGKKQDLFLSNLPCLEKGIYAHKHTDYCRRVGCKYISVVDGNWKLQYPLCMFQELMQGHIPGVTIPTNCRNSPAFASAFCEKHCQIMAEKGYPTKRREFIEKVKSKAGKQEAIEKMAESSGSTRKLRSVSKGQAIGSSGNVSANTSVARTTTSITRSETHKIVNKELLEVALPSEGQATSHEALLKSVDCSVLKTVDCFKDTGGRKNMNQWSRGHCFFVSPCGQIQRWQPLISSESPSQVFTQMIEHLVAALMDVPKVEWKKYCLVYDNMCHVNGMRAAKQPLPTHAPDGTVLFPKKLTDVFLHVTKVIDQLHISNHKDSCKKDYSPQAILELHPNIDLKTMVAEETFVWLSRFKKILCAMPKLHHHFVLHRLIVRRNRYTQKKRLNGVDVMIPVVRSQYTT